MDEGAGETNSLLCERLREADCGVAAALCMEEEGGGGGGVGEIDTLERGEGEIELSLDLVSCEMRFEDPETWL